MTIYVLRSDNLVKIGFTDKLRNRVQAIISAVPMPVEFVGSMPGDREVERHLHDRFAAQRFSGEWFVENLSMCAAFDALLTPGLPDLEPKEKKRKRRVNEDNTWVKRILRDGAAVRWPHLKHSERVEKSAAELGWNLNRVKDFYYGDPRAVIREAEAQEIEEWTALRSVARARSGAGTEG